MFERLFCEYGGFEMKLDLKSVLTGGAATVALLAASSANASGYYIGLFGGISSMEDSFDVSTSTSGARRVVGTTNTFYSYFAFGPTTVDFVHGTVNDPWGTIGTTLTTIGGFYYWYAAYTVTQGARSTTLTGSHSFDDGFVVGAAIGWDFGTGWRTELEAAYRSHDVGGRTSGAFARSYTYIAFSSSWYSTGYYFYSTNTYLALNSTSTIGFVSGNTGGTATGVSTNTYAGTGSGSFDGDLETWSFLFNIWYDFDFGDSPIHPFVGGGIGVAHASLDYQLGATGIPTGTAGLFAANTSVSYRGNGEATDWGFAYQLGAGLGFELGNGMMLSAQYRYFNTSAMDLSLADQIEVNLESHNFLVGLNIPLGGGM